MGGLSITSSTERQSLEGLTALKPLLLKTAQEIAAAAESWQFPT